MQILPIGMQSFGMLRRNNMLYVDKTAILLELIENGRRYFLSRPRRFGKSLTLSTLEEMFKGNINLFKGLKAEDWVRKQSESPSAVLKLDISSLGDYSNSDELNQALIRRLEEAAEDNELQLRTENNSGEMLRQLIRILSRRRGSVVILIDEYDKPILDNLSDLKKANDMCNVLRSFYTTLKSYDEYMRFVFITGISKFSKVGVDPAMNNLEDISLDKRYGGIAGYTQQELEYFFSERLNAAAGDMGIGRDELLVRMKNYYDGFCFDGKTRLYNPFSILQCLSKGEFRNYWYESGSPSFMVNWMKEHQIQDPEEYRQIVVNGNDFISIQEIEQADATSLLYQNGYLTIEKKEEQLLTLDYPNKEVLNSLSSMYLKLIYKVEGYALLGNAIWKALRQGNIHEVVELYNTALAGIPYDDFLSNRNEFWYRSMFVMLLRGAGIISYTEPHTSKGRADVIIQFNNLVAALEFKFAETSSQVQELKRIGAEQIIRHGYIDSYKWENRKVISAVLVADSENRKVVC